MESFPWQKLSSMEVLEQIARDSYTKPAVIFKHSTRCNISEIAMLRLEEDALKLKQSINFYYLDLLNHRDISSQVADKFQVHHESPQILVIQNGDCILEASHLDIHVDEIREVLAV